MHRPSLTWVIKSSKRCNLRCAYCYEYESLNDDARIPSSVFDALFRVTREVSEHFSANPKYCWHGGEPLLLEPAYYQAALEAQRRVFNDCERRPLNVIQTNLTAVSAKTIELLKRFDHVSISLDVIGGDRVTTAGKDSQQRVLRNMATVREEGISFGAISVLTRKNYCGVDQIFDFFNETGISFRLLPYYRSSSASQRDQFSLTPDQVAGAVRRLIDRWFTSNRGITVAPVDQYVWYATLHMFGTNGDRHHYNKLSREHVLVVDTNCDVYGVADTYSPNHRYGNLLSNSAAEIVASAGRQLAATEAASRMSQTCQTCDYFGACSGWPAAEATALERDDTNNQFKCVIAKQAIARACEWVATVPIDEFDRAQHRSPHQLEH